MYEILLASERDWKLLISSPHFSLNFRKVHKLLIEPNGSVNEMLKSESDHSGSLCAHATEWNMKGASIRNLWDPTRIEFESD
jgi:hypothetical protein